MATGSARNPGIDLLRGIAILLVLLNHIGIRIRLLKGVLAGILPHQLLTDLTFNGTEAVYIFFVISGFLIAGNSMQRWGSLGSIHAREFYVRRFARIVPCLVTLVAILALLDRIHAQGYVIRGPYQSLHGAVGSAFGLYLNLYEGHTGYLPGSWDVLWSLSIEEVFYLAFPLICLTLRKDWLLAPCLAVLALSQPFTLAAITHNPIWREKAYLPGMAGIAAGVLAAIAAPRFHPRSRWPRIALLIGGACGVLADLGFEDNLFPFIRFGVILMLTLSTAALVLGFHLQASAAPEWNLKGTRWLRSCGRLSYEIYLTHMFVVLTVVRFFELRHASLGWGFLWYAPTIALAWLLGWLVAKYFSSPCERMLRRKLMKSRIGSRKAIESPGNV